MYFHHLNLSQCLDVVRRQRQREVSLIFIDLWCISEEQKVKSGWSRVAD